MDDANAIKLLKNFTTINNFFKEKTKLNKQDIKKIFEKNKNKNLVFTGFAFDGMNKIVKSTNYKYCINLDYNQIYRQYQLRTLELINKHYKELHKLLTDNFSNLDIVAILCIHKFKIRSGFFREYPIFFKDRMQNFIAYIKEVGYKIKSSDEIYELIKTKK